LFLLSSLAWLPNNLILAQHINADSLNNLLKTQKFGNKKEQMRITMELCDLYLQTDLEKSLVFARKLHTLAIKNKDIDYEADALQSIGIVFYRQGRNDSALYNLTKSLNLFKGKGSKEKLIAIKSSIANVFRVTGKYDTAIVLYNEALKYYETSNNKIKTGKILANIGSLYYTAGNQEKANEYTLKSLEMQRISGDDEGASISLVNLTVFAINSNKFKDGIKYGEEALKLLKKQNRAYYASALVRVGYCYYNEKKPDKAFQYTTEAINIYKENNSAVGMMEAYRTLADYCMDLKQYRKAKDYGLKALQLADTTNRLDLRLLYDILKRASIYLNEPDKANYYSQEQIRLKEADLNKEWAEKIADADAKYQTEKRENTIAQLKAQKHVRTVFLYALIGIIVLASVAGFFVYKSLKQGRVLAEQKVNQLEQEKQLIATHAILEGETTERTRISKDLHDGLGGLLSGVKLKLANIKGNSVLGEDSVAQFDNAINLLDNSIKELRRVAHNMMPEALVKFGLKDGLQDFCDQVSNGKKLSVIFNFSGENKRFEKSLEITIYRIAQELTNNALKHAKATEILVQVVQEDTRIHLTVMDDGQGFDPSAIDTFKSAGLKNIRARVESFKGNMDIDSQPGKGTEIGVEFELS
jgi:signal transduction histidine kinase